MTDASNVLRQKQAAPRKFDLIFLADVWEHIPSYRLLSLWESISTLLKTTGTLYIHIPNEETQNAEQLRVSGGQFFEEVVRVDVLREQASCFGMVVTQVLPEPGYESIFVRHLQQYEH